MADAQSTWTLESLKSLLDERHIAQKEMVAIALAAAEKAVAKAEAATEKRFDGVNEFRGTLADQQRTLMPRQEAELLINALKVEIEQLKSINLKRLGQGDGSNKLWLIILSVVSLAGGLIGIATRFF